MTETSTTQTILAVTSKGQCVQVLGEGETSYTVKYDNGRRARLAKSDVTIIDL